MLISVVRRFTADSTNITISGACPRRSRRQLYQ
jgi:hypothetical protein